MLALYSKFLDMKRHPQSILMVRYGVTRVRYSNVNGRNEKRQGWVVINGVPVELTEIIKVFAMSPSNLPLTSSHYEPSQIFLPLFSDLTRFSYAASRLYREFSIISHPDSHANLRYLRFAYTPFNHFDLPANQIEILTPSHDFPMLP